MVLRWASAMSTLLPCNCPKGWGSLGPALQRAAGKEEDRRWTGGRVGMWHLGGHKQGVTSCGQLWEPLS